MPTNTEWFYVRKIVYQKVDDWNGDLRRTKTTYACEPKIYAGSEKHLQGRANNEREIIVYEENMATISLIGGIRTSVQRDVGVDTVSSSIRLFFEK